MLIVVGVHGHLAHIDCIATVGATNQYDLSNKCHARTACVKRGDCNARAGTCPMGSHMGNGGANILSVCKYQQCNRTCEIEAYRLRPCL